MANGLTLADYIQQLIPSCQPAKSAGHAEAPANIALVKYWGKRDVELNLPLTSSVSISLANHGSTTRVTEAEEDGGKDRVILNQQAVATDSAFYHRLSKFLDHFRPHPKFFFEVNTSNNIPTASGLASSASGFAALVLALNDYFQWHATDKTLSLLARVGSGSACRSLWHGFVLWEGGEQDDGYDSFAKPLDSQWPDLRIAVVLNGAEEKSISSRKAMIQTHNTSPFAKLWPDCVAKDLEIVQQAIVNQNLALLGETAEANAEAMHALMLSARPAINYANTCTLNSKAKVQTLRNQGVAVYYTQDAGPHLKLIFASENEAAIRTAFPEAEVIAPFQAIK